ncbi:S41 family peptidase [Dysgonomonas sp.]
MKKRLVLVLNTLLLITGVSAQERTLSDTEKIIGLSRLWEGVRSNFVYYDKLQLDWDSLYEASIPKILETKDSYSYIKELERIVAYAQDGHTYVYHNVAQPVGEERIKPLPFTTKLVGNKVLVDEILSSDLLKKGVTRGTEVVAINNMDVFTYAKKELGQYIPSSTPQWLYYKTMNSFELTKSKRLDPITVEFSNNGKKISAPYSNRDLDWDIQRKQRKAENENQNIEEAQTLKLTILDNNIGLLKIENFNDENFKQKFDKIYSSILSTDGLIIDLRNNGGGNSGYADYVLRHLSKRPIKTINWSSRMYIPAHASWEYPDEWYSMAAENMEPVNNKEIYINPITVMVDAGTFSSAEDFCVKFRGMKRGSIIGTATGGSTGNGVKITLIKGVAGANICSRKVIAPDGTIFVGVGVIPDIKVEETKESFLANKDIVLEKAVSEITIAFPDKN